MNEFVARNGVIAQNNSTVSGSLTVTQGITGSFTGSLVGSLTGTASYSYQSLSSSYSDTASYIQNAQSASYINPLIQDVEITGSLNVSGSQVWIYTDNYATYINEIDLLAIDTGGARFNDLSGNSSLNAESRTLQDNNGGQPSVSWNNRQLIKSDGSTVAFDWENGILTGSLYGTSSWSENSISSSYALTASYVAGASSFPFTGSAQITGSLEVTGSVTATSFSGDGTNITGITSTNVSSKLFNFYNFI